jgi:hypothetical protein
MTLQRIRPQWARDEEGGWELYTVDRFTLRYVEGHRAVDVPVEDGIRPDNQVTTHLYVDELAWRDHDGRSSPLADAERADVVPRIVRAVEFLGTVPIVHGRAPGA